jgi:nitroreductase
MTLTANGRTADHPISPLFLDRWSPRAFDGQPVPEADLMTMLEAARWAPSSSNLQPWRFLYALRGGPHWEGFLGFLNEGNRAWCKDTGALLVLVSQAMRQVPDKGEVPSYTHSHDAGCAWGYLALQATMMGYHAHGMAGFDKEGAARGLGVPDTWRVEQMIAVGRRADPAALPEALRAREQPNARRPLVETVMEGGFREG